MWQLEGKTERGWLLTLDCSKYTSHWTDKLNTGLASYDTPLHTCDLNLLNVKYGAYLPLNTSQEIAILKGKTYVNRWIFCTWKQVHLSGEE